MPWTPLIIDDKLLKEPFWLTVVPDDLLPFIGHVTVLWGFYEDLFDDFLDLMVVQSGKKPGHGWKTRHYKARIRLFKKQAKISFKDQPPILEYINKMLADSLPLHRERNIITHGRIGGTPQDYGDDIIQATGFVKKKPITIAVNQETLTKLFHGLGHLAGRMQYLHDPRDEREEDGPVPLEQHERQALRDFLSRNRRIRTNANKPQPPQKPARATIIQRTV
jgi:hypothetical protein